MTLPRILRRRRTHGRLSAQLPTPRVTQWGNRWAIDFQLDGKPQTWYTDSYEQATLFARNLKHMGAENAEFAG